MDDATACPSCRRATSVEDLDEDAATTHYCLICDLCFDAEPQPELARRRDWE